MQEHVKNKLNVFFNDYNNNKEVCWIYLVNLLWVSLSLMARITVVIRARLPSVADVFKKSQKCMGLWKKQFIIVVFTIYGLKNFFKLD